jgi:hypothetical protein
VNFGLRMVTIMAMSSNEDKSGTEEGSIDNPKMRRFVQIFYSNNKRRMSDGGTRSNSRIISKKVGLF